MSPDTTTKKRGVTAKPYQQYNKYYQKMKNLILFILVTFSTIAYSQGLKVKWEDNDGREFSITAPSGDFSYGMLAGDNISYNYNNNVSKNERTSADRLCKI